MLKSMQNAQIIRVKQKVRRAIFYIWKLIFSNVYFICKGSCDLWLIAIMCDLFMNMLGRQEGFPYTTVFTNADGEYGGYEEEESQG